MHNTHNNLSLESFRFKFKPYISTTPSPRTRPPFDYHDLSSSSTDHTQSEHWSNTFRAHVPPTDTPHQPTFSNSTKSIKHYDTQAVLWYALFFVMVILTCSEVYYLIISFIP